MGPEGDTRKQPMLRLKRVHVKSCDAVWVLLARKKESEVHVGEYFEVTQKTTLEEYRNEADKEMNH